LDSSKGDNFKEHAREDEIQSLDKRRRSYRDLQQKTTYFVLI
jgi:hypothetical protein